MNILKAQEKDYARVRRFYHSLIDGMQGSPFDIGWKKDIYPAPDFLKTSISDGDLLIGLEGEQIVAAMVLNHDCNEGYQAFNWKIKADASDITVIHALGVHPSFSGNGYAKEMVQKAINLARENRQKTIRLDVLEGNLPAEKLYVSCGFTYQGSIQLYYEDTGLTHFKLYEYLL
ncbi:GNAT family N-acetyltransferase [Streptococcus dentiloxodontae]